MATSIRHFRTLVLRICLLAGLAAGCGGPTPTPAQPAALPTTAPSAAPVATAAPPTEAPYAPVIDPANFVAGINHPYLPLTPGVTRTYEVKIAEGTERIEVTTLGETRVVQFVAYLNGRVLEHALDFLAQADGGAVWYFGEDVYNYENGVVADREGTWQAGIDGPPAMIMPAQPQVGNVYRVENIPGIVFEEVTVKAINQTLEGPRGLIEGVMFVQQAGMEGKATVKAFAPGYGEFLAHTEDAAVAVPTDTLPDTLPAELETLLTGANSIFDAASSENWDAQSATLAAMTKAWDARQSAVDLGSLFPLLDIQMARALNSLANAIEQHAPQATRDAAFDVATATLDLQLPYRPRVEIDFIRFDLWARRAIADSAAANPGHVAGDVTVLEFLWQRTGHTVDASIAQAIDAQLGALRAAADAEDLAAASDAAAALRDILAGLG